MFKKPSLAAALSLPLLAAGTTYCGARTNLDETEQSDDYVDAGTNPLPDGGPVDAGPDAPDAPDADIPPVQNITRGQLARTLKEEIMSYPDFEENCGPFSPDIPPNTALCRATNFLIERNIIKSYPDGQFKPDNEVIHAELWKIVASGLQFTPYQAPCLQSYSDLMPESWYYSYAGALCDKGITLGEKSLSNPGDATSIQELTKLKTEAIAYLSQPLDNQTLVELMSYTFLDHGPTPTDNPSDCISPYNDVPDNTLTCFHANYLIQQGFLNPNSSTLNPANQVNNASMAKTYVLLAGFPVQYTGCSGQPEGLWYTNYVDALCEAGWVNQDFNPEIVSSRWVASQLAWDMAFDQQQ